jgi:hypothetical protein
VIPQHETGILTQGLLLCAVGNRERTAREPQENSENRDTAVLRSPGCPGWEPVVRRGDTTYRLGPNLAERKVHMEQCQPIE